MVNNDTSYVCLWLEGPLQSWGGDSKFYRRDTLEFPTKSAVLGLVFSAMGLRGDQEQLLSDFNGMDMFVRGYGDHCEMPSILEDFQVMGGGYDVNNPWEFNMIPKRGDGRKPSGVSGTKLFYRYYLQNIKFGVVLEFPKYITEKLVEGLTTPVYDIFLGRKSCIPSEFVYQGICSSVQEGEDVLEGIASKKGLTQALTVRQGVVDGGELLTVNDQPIRFGLNKEYSQRIISMFKHYSFA